MVVWHAPGRVNVIGEHTDYNDGYVLPIALSLGVTARVVSRDDGLLSITSRQRLNERIEIALDDLAPGQVQGWAAYIAGVVWVLRERNIEIPGADIFIDSDLPIGAGLSSSAAVECSVAAALNDQFHGHLSPLELARVAQRAEHIFPGVPCGVMDQMASMLSVEDCALFIDTRSFATRAIPMPLAETKLALLVTNTRAPHRLVDGEYAARRASCHQSAAELGLPALRDVRDLPAALLVLKDPVSKRRTRHVVTENQRVLRVVNLLITGKFAEIGPELTASHISLRDDYEVSSPELNLAVETALAQGALGARMIGGGFGGSTIALIPTDLREQISKAISHAFEHAGFESPEFYLAVPSRGAHKIS